MSEARDLGLQALQAGDVNGAIAHLTQARDQNPADYTTLAYLGAALGRAGRAAEAVEALQSAVQLQPAQASSHYHLGLAPEHAARGAATRSVCPASRWRRPGRHGGRSLRAARAGEQRPGDALHPAAGRERSRAAGPELRHAHRARDGLGSALRPVVDALVHVLG